MASAKQQQAAETASKSWWETWFWRNTDKKKTTTSSQSCDNNDVDDDDGETSFRRFNAKTKRQAVKATSAWFLLFCLLLWTLEKFEALSCMNQPASKPASQQHMNTNITNKLA